MRYLLGYFMKVLGEPFLGINGDIRLGRWMESDQPHAPSMACVEKRGGKSNEKSEDATHGVVEQLSSGKYP